MKPKRHSQKTLSGQKGINFIEKVVLEMGFVWHSRTIDAGIDGMIELRDSETEEASNFHILVQSKATEHGFPNDNNSTFDFYSNERDIDYWLKGNAPVILICVNLTNDTAYWVNVKEYFKDAALRATKKVVFNKAKNIFSKDSKQSLLDIANQTNQGSYFSPAPKIENIISNLMLISKFPPKIYFAKTDYRKKKELWSALNQLTEKKGINKNWILKDELIYSFNDLSQSPWPNIIKGTVDSIDSIKWADSHELPIQNNFIQLLNNTFESFAHYKGLLHYNYEEINLYYFRPQLDDNNRPKPKKQYYKRFNRKSFQSVCEKYARKSDPSIISYYRHLALEVRFERYDKKWFMEINPNYFFTHDGFKIHHYYESKLKGKKALDKEPAVFSQLLFWEYVITTNNDGLFGEPILKFSNLWKDKLNAGIDDGIWLQKEDEEQEDDPSIQLKLI